MRCIAFGMPSYTVATSDAKICKRLHLECYLGEAGISANDTRAHDTLGSEPATRRAAVVAKRRHLPDLSAFLR